MACVWGLPCSSSSGGPEPPRRKRILPSATATCSRVKPGKIMATIPASGAGRPAAILGHELFELALFPVGQGVGATALHGEPVPQNADAPDHEYAKRPPRSAGQKIDGEQARDHQDVHA